MIKNYILKKFIIIFIICTNALYAQASEEYEAAKKSCKTMSDNSYWLDSENLCAHTAVFKKYNEIIHYVGNWSPNGAGGYGQLYVYDLKDGSLISLYKGEFKDSVFHGFGNFKEIYKNNEGRSVTRVTIGNWKNDRADGFLYQTVTDNETNKTSVFYGEFKDGAKHGNSIITTEKTGVNSVVWKKGKVIGHTIASMLLDEASNAWVQHKYFDNTASYSKKNN